VTVNPTGALHVEHCMGTVFSIAVRDGGDWTRAIADVVAWLHRVDAVFSTYQPGSDVSRLRRGELALEDADPLVPAVLDLCERYEGETGGAFTAHLPGGLDPTGLVKGWAIEWASDILRERGSANHAVNGGGDVQTAGESAPGRPWRIGISDPHRPGTVLTAVSGRGIAVATSGVAERGAHIVDPSTGTSAEGLASVTVVGRSLTVVDAYATAAFVKGEGALAWLESGVGHEGLIVSHDGSTRRTSGFASRYEPESKRGDSA